MSIVNGFYATFTWFHASPDEQGCYSYGIGEKGYRGMGLRTLGTATSAAAAKAEADALGAQHDLPVQPMARRPKPKPKAVAQSSAAIEEKWTAAVCKGAAFEGAQSAEPIVMSEQNLAMGKLGDWLTAESAGKPGVFRCSAAVAAQPQGQYKYIIVRYRGELAAVTLEEAYTHCLRETTEGVGWHRKMGWHAFENKVADALRRFA